MKQRESGSADMDYDSYLGRADDLSWALGYVSWGDPEKPLGTDLSSATKLDVSLKQSWSVVFVACLLRGWLPQDDRTCETIGEFLPLSEANEGRAIQNLIDRIQASSDPRLELSPAISGSIWPRVDAYNALEWAVSSDADELVEMTDAVRDLARAATRTVSSKAPMIRRPLGKDELAEFKPKSANALFTMFLALTYTTWGASDLEDSDAVLEHIKGLLKERQPDRELEPFQLAIIRKAENMQPGQFAKILANAKQLFTAKSNIGKDAKAISLGRAQTP